VGAVLSVVALGVLGLASARAAEPGNGDLEIVPVTKNIYMIPGDGGNVVVQVGVDGIVLANSGAADGTDRLLAAIRKISPLPIRYIINTDGDPDSVGGNSAIAAAGQSLYNPPLGPGASVMAFSTVLARVAQTPGYPDSGWPTEAFLSPQYSLIINGEPIVVFHQPAAHSDGDIFVLFRNSDVVDAGNVMDMSRFPMIDLAHGGSIQGEIAALDRLLELAIPPAPLVYDYSDNATDVIPAHGRICEQWEVVDYRDMVVIITDTIADMMKRHMTLDQIEAADPTKAYEARYGSTTGPWTTNMFVAAVYQSLKAADSKKK
jgi:glyoxylase-like metal-dependent hydrolase (beta-lactamase superfamily II)